MILALVIVGIGALLLGLLYIGSEKKLAHAEGRNKALTARLSEAAKQAYQLELLLSQTALHVTYQQDLLAVAASRTHDGTFAASEGDIAYVRSMGKVESHYDGDLGAWVIEWTPETMPRS